MRNFFNSILQQKKPLFFAFLFLVVLGSLLPVIASAAPANEGILAQLSNLPRRLTLTVGTFVIVAPALLVSYIFRMLADMSYVMLEYVIGQMIEDPQGIWAITRNNANGLGAVFVQSWHMVKSYANMLIVLGLIGIAVATILRFREWEAKRLLIPILVVALLVNFSGLFIGLTIDASNILMRSLTVGSEQEGNIITHINTARDNITLPLYVEAMETIWTSEDWATPFYKALGYAASEFIFSIIYVVIAATFFLLTLVFIQRYIMLAILFIISPVAFVLYVFPFSKELFSKWWHLFLKWCFAGLIAAFFLRLSVSVLSSPVLNNWQTNQGDSILTVMPRIIMQLVIVLGFIVAGYKFAKKGAGPAANLVMGGAKGVAGFAIGGIKGAGLAAGGIIKGAGKVISGVGRAIPGVGTVVGGGAGGIVGGIGGAFKWKMREGAKAGARYGANAGRQTVQGLTLGVGSGLDLAGKAITKTPEVTDELARKAVGKTREGLGIDVQGTAKMDAQNRMTEKMKPYEKVAEAEKDNDIVAQRAMNSKTSAERAAYIAVAHKRKKLNKIPQANRQQAINDASAHGIDTSEFSKADYRYAEFDEKITKRIEKANQKAHARDPIRNPLLTPDQVKAKAIEDQLEENISSMSPEQRRNIDKDHLTSGLVTGRSLTANMARNFRTADRGRIRKLRSMRNQIQAAITAASAANLKGEVNRLRSILKEINDLPY